MRGMQRTGAGMRAAMGLWVVVAATASVGCGGDAGAPAPSAASPVPKTSIPTQALKHSCEWLSQAEVEEALGPLAGAPEHGNDACVYPVNLPRGPGQVVLRVEISSESAFEQGMGSFGALAAEELTGSRHGARSSRPRNDGWDYAGGLPNQAVWRLGTLQVELRGNYFGLPKEKLDRLALLVRERVTDLPFAAPGGDSNAMFDDPDPCALLTRADAEAVLGKLVVDPYRAVKGSPLADAAGASCAYYTAGHHVFVLTPMRQDARTIFGMAAGVGGLARKVMGGADEGDALDGPWDQATSNPGKLHFLRGDEMLTLTYHNSSTDAAGAAKLARTAVPRL